MQNVFQLISTARAVLDSLFIPVIKASPFMCDLALSRFLVQSIVCESLFCKDCILKIKVELLRTGEYLV